MVLAVRKSPLKQRMRVSLHPALRQFLAKEPDIRREIERFAAGLTDVNEICIAGPLSVEEQMKLVAEPDRPISLPCISIQFAIAVDNKSGERYCRIIASEQDIATVEGWNRTLALGALAPRARLGLPIGSPN